MLSVSSLLKVLLISNNFDYAIIPIILSANNTNIAIVEISYSNNIDVTNSNLKTDMTQEGATFVQKAVKIVNNKVLGTYPDNLTKINGLGENLTLRIQYSNISLCSVTNLLLSMLTLVKSNIAKYKFSLICDLLFTAGLQYKSHSIVTFKNINELVLNLGYTVNNSNNEAPVESSKEEKLGPIKNTSDIREL